MYMLCNVLSAYLTTLSVAENKSDARIVGHEIEIAGGIVLDSVLIFSCAFYINSRKPVQPPCCRKFVCAISLKGRDPAISKEVAVTGARKGRLGSTAFLKGFSVCGHRDSGIRNLWT
jgi:hypothetical protein